MKSIRKRASLIGVRKTILSSFIMLVGQRPLPEFKLVSQFFVQRYGVEIGGPSKEFTRSGLIPVYKAASKIDIINFSDDNLWDKAGSALVNKKK